MDRVTQFAALIGRLKAFEQRKYFNAVVVYVSTRFFQSEIVSNDDEKIAQSPTVSGAATLLNSFMSTNEVLKDHIVSSLTKSTIPSLDDSFATRRCVIAALAQDEGEDSKLHINFVVQALIQRRQAANPSRELHQDIRRFYIRQAYTCHAARMSVRPFAVLNQN